MIESVHNHCTSQSPQSLEDDKLHGLRKQNLKFGTTRMWCKTYLRWLVHDLKIRRDYQHWKITTVAFITSPGNTNKKIEFTLHGLLIAIAPLWLTNGRIWRAPSSRSSARTYLLKFSHLEMIRPEIFKSALENWRRQSIIVKFNGVLWIVCDDKDSTPFTDLNGIS